MIRRRTFLACARHRTFSTQNCLLQTADETITETPSTTAEAEEPAKTSSHTMSKNAMDHKHRKAFVTWLQSKGKQFEQPSRKGGPNYLDGKPYPFPLNPTFQPLPPLDQATKTAIYEAWKAGKTLSQLTQSFGVSFERLEAILHLQQIKLKRLEEVCDFPHCRHLMLRTISLEDPIWLHISLMLCMLL